MHFRGGLKSLYQKVLYYFARMATEIVEDEVARVAEKIYRVLVDRFDVRLSKGDISMFLKVTIQDKARAELERLARSLAEAPRHPSER